MDRHARMTHAILWGAAILAAAILKAPPTLTVLILPVLATLAVVTTGARKRPEGS